MEHKIYVDNEDCFNVGDTLQIGESKKPICKSVKKNLEKMGFIVNDQSLKQRFVVTKKYGNSVELHQHNYADEGE